MTAPYQYARTTNQNVIEAVLGNEEGFQKFRQEAFAFASAQGAPDGAYFGSSFAGTHAISAVGGDTKPTTGRWKEGYHRGWLPFKNNPLAKELESIRFREAPIPGMPSLVDGPASGSGHIVGTPRPFIVDGVVYCGFSFVPRPEEEGTYRPNDREAGGWEEIKASEFHAALETYNERIQGESA